MTPYQFDNVLSGTRINPRGSIGKACRLVLVDGMSRNAAAIQLGINTAAVSRAVKRLQQPHCPTCKCHRS